MAEYAAKALAIDPDNAAALISNTYFNIMNGQLDEALACAQRAVRGAPNSDEAIFARDWAEMFIGRYEEAVNSVEQALRLCPIPTSVRLGVMASAYRNAGRYVDSIMTFRHLIKRYPDFFFGYSGLASAYALQGDMEKARETVAEVMRRDPTYSVERFIHPDFYSDDAIMKACAVALRKAGMPEGQPE